MYKIAQLRRVIQNPGDVVLALRPRSYPEWQGQSLAAILESEPEDSPRFLAFLANGYGGPFELKLAAALLLARQHGREPNEKARKPRPRQTAKPVDGSLSGATLKQAIPHLRKAIRRRASLPELHAILSRQIPEGLVLENTNLETSLRLTLPLPTDDEPWETLVDARLLPTRSRTSARARVSQSPRATRPARSYWRARHSSYSSCALLHPRQLVRRRPRHRSRDSTPFPLLAFSR
jgi:hypothetical protein